MDTHSTAHRATRRLVLVLALIAVAALIAHQSGLLERTARGRAARMTPERASRLLEQYPDVVVLDVNTPLEFREGHIPGSENLDYHSPYFAAAIKGMDRDVTYLVVCAAGTRSRMAAEHMAEMGFTDVHDLAGGLRAWARAGLPLEKGE